jgi:xanthine dehydrogenase molybdopterin-binding subunit B
MEHIAKAIKKDPIDVRLKNLKKDDDSNIQNMIQDLKVTADFEARKQNIEDFNKVSGTVYCASVLFLQNDMFRSNQVIFRPFLNL